MEKAIIEMSEQIPSLICINMINTNIFISPGASGLTEVHLQCVAYGNQDRASKREVQSTLGDVMQTGVWDLTWLSSIAENSCAGTSS